MKRVRRVLVPVDFSSGAQQALDYAADLLAKDGAQIVMLHVVEPLYYATPADLYGAPANLNALLDEQRRAAEGQLTKLAQRLLKRRVRVKAMLQTGVAYQAILAAADELKVDLIVMATHGRTGLSHLLLGSVAEKVVRAARCPVLTVRAYDKKRRSARPKR
jgi:nucleotide-binding universal stress UspA family protein